MRTGGGSFEFEVEAEGWEKITWGFPKPGKVGNTFRYFKRISISAGIDQSIVDGVYKPGRANARKEKRINA